MAVDKEETRKVDGGVAAAGALETTTRARRCIF